MNLKYVLDRRHKKENPYIIIKMFGILPADIEDLHSTCRADEMQKAGKDALDLPAKQRLACRAEVKRADGVSSGGQAVLEVPLVEILSCRLDPAKDTYVAEVKIPVAMNAAL